jgi:hypothetical protein
VEKDENVTEQMIAIIQHLQKYVPKTGSEIMILLLQGGDQLSVERGESAQRARMDSVTPDIDYKDSYGRVKIDMIISFHYRYQVVLFYQVDVWKK